MPFMQDVHSKCWLYLISIRNSIFTVFVQLVCDKYFVMYCYIFLKLDCFFSTVFIPNISYRVFPQKGLYV